VSRLPADFRDLERFAPWMLETERERNAKRFASSMDEIRDFYEAVKPRMDAVVAYLDQFPLDELPDDARRLLLLGLSLMEVSPAVEWFGRPQAVAGFDAHQMIPIEPTPGGSDEVQHDGPDQDRRLPDRQRG